MKRYICPKCGKEFESNYMTAYCSNCGCIAQEAPIVYGTAQNAAHPTTTDTGYKHEKTVKTYVDVLFWIFLGLGVIYFIIGLQEASSMSSHFVTSAKSVAIYILVGSIALILWFLLLTFIRSMYMLLVNISTNLHEINMKIK